MATPLKMLTDATRRIGFVNRFTTLPVRAYAAMYAGIAREQFDTTSKTIFASKSDDELVKLTIGSSLTCLMGPLEIKRDRPLISRTTGSYTTTGRWVRRVTTVLAVPYLALSLNEIARRKSESSEARREREISLTISKIKL